MIQVQLKLRLCKAQERELERWLFHLQSVWNWAVRKIELNANNRIYFKRSEFNNLLAGHGQKLGIPSHVIQGVLSTAHVSWQRCFKGLARKPRLKGHRNSLVSIPFPDPFRSPKGRRISVLGIGSVRFFEMKIPQGAIKSGRIVRRASGWYLCLFIDAEPRGVSRIAAGEIGIDPGFKSLIAMSNGEKVSHPREQESGANRLAQAQRGNNRQLAARLRERIANRRKDRNHKLSRQLVAENTLIAWSLDNHNAIARRFGKSVHDSGHAELRLMLAYKSRTGGTRFIEVSNRHSTMTCSACGALSGPAGLSGLAVREWQCSGCGTHHDRDCNAAMNTLLLGLGISHGVQKPQESRNSNWRRGDLKSREAGGQL